MPEPIPGPVRLILAHAAVQVVADDCGVDVLHIKGEAQHPLVRRVGRESTDVDVLVRPAQIVRLLAVLQKRGWTLVSGFKSSSAFEHSATLINTTWGYLDVHRHYPGFGVPSAEAFDHLWLARTRWAAGGVGCAVPDVVAQRLILLLHAARSAHSDRARADVDHVWHYTDEVDRARVTQLAARLQAGVALGAAIGDLEPWRDDPTYPLWLIASTGGTRRQEWAARIRATPTLLGKTRLVLQAPLVNVDHLAVLRGHRPSWREVIVEFFARPVRGGAEEWSQRRRIGRRRVGRHRERA